MSINQISSNLPASFPTERARVNPSEKLLVIDQHAAEQTDRNPELTKEKLEEVVKSMNQFLKPSHTSLKFQLHDELQEYYVSIVDDITKEVVREIPSKKLLDMYAAMTEFLGLVVDKKI
ncbi:flagellar protein FlaG [Bacillus sp. BGMRC 2118]|nr:flagellar protein FlaG [Bacillus sp. BGMRC 2118]